MKHVKKLASILLALVMVFSMTITTFAATIDNQTNHAYKAYQIFKGTQDAGSAALGSVDWGDGIKASAFLAALKGDARFEVGENNVNIFEGCSSAADVADVLGNYEDKSEVAKAFANVAAQHRSDIAVEIAASANEIQLSSGYYLLVDISEVGEGDARNTALLQVTNKGNITIEKKYDVPTVDKSVTDNDVNNTKGEAADYFIGDDVPFTLTGTLPSNYADYETYKYVFHDTLSKNLKLNATYDGTGAVTNGVTVKAGSNDITSSFTITYSDNKLTVACNNLKAITGLTASSKIVVEYTAELLASAVIGKPGNENKVYLEYSNDPNHTGDGTTSNTPWDEVLVFTYELDVTKVDGQDSTKKLGNAEFVLMNSDKNKVAKVANGKFVEWMNDSGISKNADGTYPAEYTLKSDAATGLFVLAGLDAGTYYLKETKAPSGYNLLAAPIKIVISATLDKSENNPALKTLTISVDDGAAVDGNLDSGAVSTSVENNSGSTLPETGGMGTTLFYVIGGILVVGAAILLVAKKRMNAEK